MPACRAARAAFALGACLAALAWNALVPGPVDARGPSPREPRMGERPMSTDGGVWRAQDARERPPSMDRRAPRESIDGRMPREPGRRERQGTILDRPGQLTPEKIDRWRRMSPEERERIRERYRRWKSLPPERRERLIDRSRRWRELPEGERRFLRQRQEMYRNAWPEERRVIDKFFARWRQLPPDRRRALKLRIAEWRELPAAERDERMTSWPFYNGLRPDERRVVRWYLFSGPQPSQERAPHE